VLLADDEPDVRAALRVLLEDEEAEDIAVVGEAGDGVEAIYSTQLLRPDVLLLDLAMPELDGVHAARVLRRTVPQTRIVVLTGTGAARAPELLQLDVCGYLGKPVQGPELVDAVRAAHGGHTCLAPTVAPLLRAPAAEAGPTTRELEVLRLVADGCSNRCIAQHLAVCERTVAGQVASLCAKVGARDRAELVHRAHQRGWLI
jgi:DNA-binding NarL/FixJ family response regulator